jgi:uncharacterized protein with HEPN domain
MNAEDKIRLTHMRDYAVLAIGFAEGKTRQILEDDLQFQLALIRAIEIIGEAASRVTEETKLKYPEIPWKPIISIRNRLIHGYMDINLDILWNTIQQELPEFIIQLNRILAIE